jgi:hypothetical protein
MVPGSRAAAGVQPMVNTNPSNQGSAGNQPFVESFEKAITQFVILQKAQQGDVTKDNLPNVFKGNLQMSRNHVDDSIRTLVQTGHLKENGNKYTITDDGREDVQKVANLVIELPQYVQQGGAMGGQQQRPGMARTAGQTGGNAPGSQGNLGQGRY